MNGVITVHLVILTYDANLNNSDNSLALIACAKKLENEDLVGKYGHSEGADTIVMNTDGTYHHYLITTSGQRLENKGNWKYDSKSNEVLFEDFSFLIDNYPAGNWFSRIRTQDGEIDLMYSSENNIYYRKKGTIIKESLD